MGEIRIKGPGKHMNPKS